LSSQEGFFFEGILLKIQDGLIFEGSAFTSIYSHAFVTITERN